MRAACRAAGLLALFSLLLWAFTGIPLWASVADSPGRGLILGLLHLVALIVGLMSLDGSMWE